MRHEVHLSFIYFQAKLELFPWLADKLKLDQLECARYAYVMCSFWMFFLISIEYFSTGFGPHSTSFILWIWLFAVCSLFPLSITISKRKRIIAHNMIYYRRTINFVKLIIIQCIYLLFSLFRLFFFFGFLSCPVDQRPFRYWNFLPATQLTFTYISMHTQPYKKKITHKFKRVFSIFISNKI